MSNVVVVVRLARSVRVVLSGARGRPGRSAYESYVATTSDDPVLTEEQWSAPSTVGAITYDGNGNGSFQDQDDITRYVAVYETPPFP